MALQRIYETETTNLARLSEEQLSARSWGIATNIILLPGIGALFEGPEAEISETKGKLLAVKDEMSKRCDEEG